jgi:cytochrome c2
VKIPCGKIVAVLFGAVAGAFCLSPLATANLKEMKAYKSAFPEAKLKCSVCHAVEKPSKDGPHELNDYGKTAVSIDAHPTAETFKKAGKAEDFKK